ncbi:MAG: hypothetical protein U0573_05120 [Phycisphaerales bacterium]|nr:hypothetical protein [Planctomycetota bacterium]
MNTVPVPQNRPGFGEGLAGDTKGMGPSAPRSGAGEMVLRWLGRGTGVLFAIFWSLFFFEHLREWYIHRPAEGFPPPWVTLAMVAHAGMVLGLFALMRWEKSGVIIATISTLAFFFLCIAGARAPWIVLINFVPIGFVAMSWAAHAGKRS